MTGSGKTGLGVDLLEEALLDGIPCLVIDPKGDMGNLTLDFPEFRPSDFRPWIDQAEAVRDGKDPDDGRRRYGGHLERGARLVGHRPGSYAPPPGRGRDDD